jgi:iron complex outermembrane receptor protein
MSPAPRRRARRWRLPCLVLALLLCAHGAAAQVSAPPVIDAPEVTISATREERDLLDVPGNLTVIDRFAIERSGARNVPDLLRREAGLFVTNTTSNPLGYTVEARGFQNGGGNGCHTLVLVDGRRLNEPDTGCPDWSLVPLDQIERIEVLRGPVSAAYGDHGAGGVIQIVTRHGRAEPGVRAVATGRSGGFDTDGGDLLLEGGEGAVTATAFVEDETSDSYRDSADFARRRGELGLRFALPAESALELQGGYASVHREQPGDLTRAEWRQDPRQAEPGSGDNFDEERERYLQARLALRPHDRVTLEVAPYVRRTAQDTRLAEATFTFTTDTEIDAVGVASQLGWAGEWREGLGLRLLGGVDAAQQDADRRSLFDDGAFPFAQHNSSRRKTVGVFLHHELELLERLVLSGGVRRDRADTEGEDEIAGCGAPGGCPDERHVIWSPRVALNWRAADPVSAYLSWSRGFRYPNLDEAFGFFGFAPRLDPERSETWEIGAKLRRRGLSANLALYHMNVADEIFFDPVAINPITTFPGLNVNVDRVRHRGVELSGSLAPCAWLELYGSYSYDHVEIRQHRASPALEGKRLPITPEHRGYLGVLLTLPHGFEAGVSGSFVGSRWLANDVENDDRELPKFASYDARIGWRRELGQGIRLALDLTGYNLADRSYAEFGGVSLFDPTDLGYFPAPGRHYVASARLELRR